MKRPARSFSKPAFQGWAEHLPDHGEFPPLAEEAVMAAPEGSLFTKALLEPESWWNQTEAEQHLQDRNLPIWISLTQGRSELFREVDGLALVTAPWLEQGRRGDAKLPNVQDIFI